VEIDRRSVTRARDDRGPHGRDRARRAGQSPAPGCWRAGTRSVAWSDDAAQWKPRNCLWRRRELNPRPRPLRTERLQA